MSTASPTAGRIESLDQFRGYTVAGMFLVNFLGSYAVVNHIFAHHNTYNSYADTILPQFYFAVGFAYRLTLLRRLKTLGPVPAYLRVLRRNLGLLLVAWIVHGLDRPDAKTWSEFTDWGVTGFLSTSFQRGVFQTLTHIAVTALWIMPVIAAGVWVRLAFLLFSAGLHVYLSQQFYFEFAWTRPVIDGGSMGFLNYTIPMLVGSFAYDAMAAPRRPRIGAMAVGAVGLLAAGIGMSSLSILYLNPDTPTLTGKHANVAASPVIPPRGGEFSLSNPEHVQCIVPFVPPPEERKMNYWMMSQRAGTLSYLTFAAGFSLGVYVLFVLITDLGGLQLGVLSTFGKNALAGYVLHSMVGREVKKFIPPDSEVLWICFCFAVFFAVTYVIVRHLEKQGIFFRL